MWISGKEGQAAGCGRGEQVQNRPTVRQVCLLGHPRVQSVRLPLVQLQREHVQALRVVRPVLQRAQGGVPPGVGGGGGKKLIRKTG